MAGFIDYLDAHEGGIWIWSALLITLEIVAGTHPTFQLLDIVFDDHFGLDFRRHLPSARYLPRSYLSCHAMWSVRFYVGSL